MVNKTLKNLILSGAQLEASLKGRFFPPRMPMQNVSK
jgi:hypothetical protein